MNRNEIEYRAALGISQVMAGSRSEDDWVEIKGSLTSDSSNRVSFRGKGHSCPNRSRGARWRLH